MKLTEIFEQSELLKIYQEIFDQAKIADAILHALAKKKGVALEEGGMLDYQVFKEKEYDKLADTLREYLNMEEIYGMLREADLD